MEPAGRMPSVFDEDFEIEAVDHKMYTVELGDMKSAFKLGMSICVVQIIEITMKGDAYSARRSVESTILMFKPRERIELVDIPNFVSVPLMRFRVTRSMFRERSRAGLW
jgi:hypothetical protein